MITQHVRSDGPRATKHQSSFANRRLLGLLGSSARQIVDKKDATRNTLAHLWIPVVTLAEFVGFAVPACVGVITASSSAAVILPMLLVAGAVEGAVLGWGQVTVLRHALPALSRRRWIIATAGAAAFAYLLGLAPSTWAAGVTDWPPVATIAVMATLALLLLASIGSAQWLVLRRHVTHGVRWIPITATAWLVGLAVFLAFTMPLWHEGQALALTILIAIIGGFLMAATTSVITGLGLSRILPRDDSSW